MWFFVDETWSPEEYEPKYGILMGVLVKDEELKALDDFLFAIRKKYYGKDHAKDLNHELKGSKLLSNSVLKMIKPGEPIPKNVCIVKEMLSFPIQRDIYIKAFASTVYSGNKNNPSLLSPNSKQLAEPFRRLIENVAQAALEDVPGRKVTLVFDQRLDAQKGISIAIKNYVAGLKLPNVEVYPYFAVSNVSPGVQFADVLAYILSKRVQGKEKKLYSDMKQLCWESKGTPKKYGLMLFDEMRVGKNYKYVVRKKW
jgi:hypothetical protein